MGRIPPQGDPQADENTTSYMTGWLMGVSPAGGHNGRVRITGGRYIRLLFPEHSRTVHCDQAHYGPVSGGVEEAGVKGGQAVVLAGWIGIGGYADGILGGGTDGGGGRRWTGRRQRRIKLVGGYCNKLNLR